MTVWYSTIWVSTCAPSPRKVKKQKPRPPATFEKALGNELRTDWWNIRGYGPGSSYSKYERRGWVGITMTNYNPREWALCRKWAKAQGSCVHMSPQEQGGGEIDAHHYIGEYETFCVCLWFSTSELRDQFIDLLKTFPVRNTVLRCNKDRLKNIRAYLKGTNYHVLEGDQGCAIGITSEISEDDLTLVRLML